MIIGIIFVSICKATYGGDYFFATSAFIPFIIQVVLLVGYIVVGKFVPNKVLAQNNANNFQQATNQNSQKPKPVTKSNLEMLEKLASLKASGAITEEEFNEKKKELLGL
ncbi:MAG: SHOCT domain-containing protein [Clostridia bacterium]|nr:SHOCT domain-containing protein [Clostridia bacterium]